MYRMICSVNFISFLVIVVLAGQTVGGDRPIEQSQHLVETIVAGIESNYSKIRTLEAIVEEEVIDATVQKEGVAITKMPGGGTITVTQSPRLRQEWTFFLDGDRIRRDVRTLGKQSDSTILIDGGVYTQYEPEFKTAWSRHVEQMPGMLPVDIRELGSPSLQESFLTILKKDKIVSANLVTDGKGKSVIQIETEGHAENREWVFDPSNGFLPIRWIARHKDRSIRELVLLTYQRVLDGTTCLPLEMKTMFFDMGVTSEILETKWKQYHRVHIKECVTINKPLAEEHFVLKLPNGTRVNDLVNTSSKVIGSEKLKAKRQAEFAAMASWKGIVPAFCVIAVCVSTCILFVRYRARKCNKG